MLVVPRACTVGSLFIEGAAAAARGAARVSGVLLLMLPHKERGGRSARVRWRSNWPLLDVVMAACVACFGVLKKESKKFLG